MSEKRNLPGEAEMHRAMNATPEEHAQLREALAELAWGVLVADGLTEAGGRRASIAAHAIVGNQLPLLADVLAERDRLRAVVERVEALAAELEQRKTRALVAAGGYWEPAERCSLTGRSMGLGIAERLLTEALAERPQMPQDGSGPSRHTGSAPTTPPRASQGADGGV